MRATGLLVRRAERESQPRINKRYAAADCVVKCANFGVFLKSLISGSKARLFLTICGTSC